MLAMAADWLLKALGCPPLSWACPPDWIGAVATFQLWSAQSVFQPRPSIEPKGSPLVQWVRPVRFQPPMNASVSRLTPLARSLPRPKGSAPMALTVMVCRTS
jgi:hypothetical protein